MTCGAYQYIFSEKTLFEENRIKQLQAIKHTAYDIIDFIAQFEDELRRVWEKPKFVRNVHYVVTLDKLGDNTLDNLARHKGVKAQIKEWRALGMVDDTFSMQTLFNGQGNLYRKNGTGDDYKYLPLDTKHFKSLELDILNDLGNLDEALDGELVHSENWQALNTLQRRYREKVKCIYIDPPFNLDSSDQFDYRTNYKDACWATMLKNRIATSREFLSEDGSIFVRCGHDGNHVLRFILNNTMGDENYRNEIIVRRAEKQKGELMKQFSNMRAMMVNYDNLYWFSKNEKARFNFIKKPLDKKQGKAHWHSFWQAEDRKDLRYELLGIDLRKEGRGQWMCSKQRAMRAVENYKKYETGFAPKMSLEVYWKQNLEQYYENNKLPFEFIKREQKGTGISSVKYWVPPRSHVVSDNDWTDIRGYSNFTGFKTENSELLLKRILEHIPNNNDFILDFFFRQRNDTGGSTEIRA